jgi:hypothetical protein
MDLWFIGLMVVLAGLTWGGIVLCERLLRTMSGAPLDRPGYHARAVRLPAVRNAQSGELLK